MANYGYNNYDEFQWYGQSEFEEALRRAHTAGFLEDEEQEDEEGEIKDHVQSFIEAFDVSDDDQDEVIKILKKKNSERTLEEKNFLKELINKKKREKPKINIVRQGEEEEEYEESCENDDDWEECDEEYDDEDEDDDEYNEEYEDSKLSRIQKLEDFRKKIQDLYQIADLKEWADLEYNQNQYDYLQDLIKKM